MRYKGEKDEVVPGLICIVPCTVGLLRKLSLVLPTVKFCAVAMGLWQSKLLFGLALVGGQLLPEPYLQRQLNHLTTTKGEMEVLHKLQNQMM